jgi:hypothetical protein
MSALANNSDLCDLLGLDLPPSATAEARMFEAGVIFKDMDVDGNSTIDVDEFVAFFGIAPSDDLEAPTASAAVSANVESLEEEVDISEEPCFPATTNKTDV